MAISAKTLKVERNEGETLLNRARVVVFAAARDQRSDLLRARAVREQLLDMHARKTLTLTAVLNEEEPYKTLALECLTHMRRTGAHKSAISVPAEGPNPFAGWQVELRHRGMDKLKIKELTSVGTAEREESEVEYIERAQLWVLSERRQINESTYDPNKDGSADPSERFARDFLPWRPGLAIKVDLQEGIKLLCKHGWYVGTVPNRLRVKYRPLVEVVNNCDVGFNGALIEPRKGKAA